MDEVRMGSATMIEIKSDKGEKFTAWADGELSGDERSRDSRIGDARVRDGRSIDAMHF
jgi:hypothetical protein